MDLRKLAPYPRRVGLCVVDLPGPLSLSPWMRFLIAKGWSEGQVVPTGAGRGNERDMTEPTQQPDVWEIIAGDGPDWQLGDPRWLIYARGWRVGYRAAEHDAVERLSAEAVDNLVLTRIAEILGNLRPADG
jgi:hypothetical protein